MRKRYMHISAPLNMSFLLHFFNLKIVCNEKKTVSFLLGYYAPSDFIPAKKVVRNSNQVQTEEASVAARPGS